MFKVILLLHRRASVILGKLVESVEQDLQARLVLRVQDIWLEQDGLDLTKRTFLWWRPEQVRKGCRQSVSSVWLPKQEWGLIVTMLHWW